MSAQDEGPVSFAYKTKRFIAQASLMALGATFELVSKWDKDLQQEIADWANPLTFSMGVLPNGPIMHMEKVGDRVKFLGMKERTTDIVFWFKNLDSAILAFTARISTPTAIAQRRTVVYGNLTEGMKVSRALQKVQTYLFPAFMMNPISKSPVRMSAEQLWIKAKVMAALTPSIIWAAIK